VSYPTTPASSVRGGLGTSTMESPLRTGSELSAIVSDDVEVRAAPLTCSTYLACC
jgi:hypothetical protein